MYKIKVKIPQKRLQQISNDTFETKEKASEFIQMSINRQYALCCKGWGLVASKQETNNNITKATFSPACYVLSKPLNVFFEIITL